MKLWKINAPILLVAAVIATPALAANTPGVQNDNAHNHASNPAPTTIREKLADNLAKAGFTDIKIMPESFLIRAKDADGNPVMMVINPDSLTAMTQISAPASGNQKTSGNNANGGKVLRGADANGDPTPPRNSERRHVVSESVFD